MDELSCLIMQKLERMVEDADPRRIDYKRKTISALFLYAVFLEQGGQRRMADAISRAASISIPIYGGFMWYRVKPLITTLFKKPNPPSLVWVLGLISPRAPWHDEPHDKNMVARRAAAASTASYPEEVCWSVADELLYLAFVDSPQPRGPPRFPQRPEGTRRDITRQVRTLGDVEILTSYLFLVWSEPGPIRSKVLTEMMISIREDFGGIGMGRHREVLTKRLDWILDDLERRWWHRPGFRETKNLLRAKEQYGELKRAVLEVEGGSVNTLTRTSPRLIVLCILKPTNTRRIPHDLHVRFTSPVTVISRSEDLVHILRSTSSPAHRSSSWRLAPSLFLSLRMTRFAWTYLPLPNFPGGQWTSRVDIGHCGALELFFASGFMSPLY